MLLKGCQEESVGWLRLFSDIQDGLATDTKKFIDARASVVHAKPRLPTRYLNIITEDELPLTTA